MARPKLNTPEPVPSNYTYDEIQGIAARQTVDKTLAATRFEQIARTFIAEHGRLAILCQEDNNMFYEYNNGVYEEVKIEEINARMLQHFYQKELVTHISAAKVKDAVQRVIWTLRATPGRYFFREHVKREYINMQNGLLDIKTRDLIAHTPTYFSTTQLPFKYQPDAVCPEFQEFVLDITCNDSELVKMVQEMFGYCMQVGNPKHKIFFLYGRTGRNGKSTVAKILQHLIGDRNTSALSLQQLSSDNTHLTVGLVNSQLNFSEEVSMKYIETTHLTNLTAEGMITVNPKNKPPFLLKILTKFIVTCNDIPRFQSSQGMFKRQIIIPFNASFEGKENFNIVDELLLEAPGILNWALDGLDRLNQKGFTIAEASAIEMEEAKLESNPVIEYIRTMFDFDLTSEQRYYSGHIYGLPADKESEATEYLAWCKLMGIGAMSKKKFTMELKRFADDTKLFAVKRDGTGQSIIGLRRKLTMKRLREDIEKGVKYESEEVEADENNGLDF